jgi:hypothetical protein
MSKMAKVTKVTKGPKGRVINDNVIICTYVMAPFDRLRVTGHGEPVEPYDRCSLSDDSHAQYFMTQCIEFQFSRSALSFLSYGCPFRCL